MKLSTLLLLSAFGVMAQTPAENPLVASSKATYAIAKTDVLKSVDKIPDNLWSYKPTPEVRTVAALFAHIADGQYEFCGPATGAKVDKKIEETKKTKAEIVAALKEGFAFCDAALAKMTDKTAADMMDVFGMKLSRLGILDFNTAHTMEHYGNLVTYMRMNKIVPPSSSGN